jgi:H+/Cl- antiporter ClcA
MHMEMVVHALLHATVAGVIGFFVLFAASKADGIVKLVGTLLGWWLWIIAVLSIVCVFVCPAMGDKGMGWMHDRLGMHGDAMAPAKPEAAAPAAPAPKKP